MKRLFKINSSLIVLSFIALTAGILGFAFNHQWIVISFPMIDGGALPGNQNLCILNQQYKIYFFNGGTLNFELVEVPLAETSIQSIKNLVNTWLTVCKHSGCFSKKIELESAVLTASDTQLYLSFTRSLFNKQSSAFEKWMQIESLLKTIRSSANNIKKITFLVNYQPMDDSQLDFSQAWPIRGFINER